MLETLCCHVRSARAGQVNAALAGLSDMLAGMSVKDGRNAAQTPAAAAPAVIAQPASQVHCERERAMDAFCRLMKVADWPDPGPHACSPYPSCYSMLAFSGPPALDY